jgi:hypothetical protein
MSYSTPAEIVENSDLKIAHLDVKKALANYEDTGKNFLAMGTFRLGKNSFKIALNGELTTDGVLVGEFNKIPNYSFGFRFENPDDLSAMETLSELLADHLKESSDDDWELTSAVKEDKMYIKLKTTPDKKRFNLLSNVKLDPKKLGDAGLTRGQKVQVIGDLGVYCNLPDKKAGVTFSVRKLEFELDV